MNIDNLFVWLIFYRILWSEIVKFVCIYVQKFRFVCIKFVSFSDMCEYWQYLRYLVRYALKHIRGFVYPNKNS